MSPNAVCLDETRRLAVHERGWNGLDYVEVTDDLPALCVHFFGRIPEGLGPGDLTLSGGRRIRDVRILEVKVNASDDPELDDCLHITLNKRGDFSPYTLCIADREGFDPRYLCIEFRFHQDCPADLDCAVENLCAPDPPEEPDLNYLAKDYPTFRQLILDRLALIMPEWQQRHVPDLGITLVELLAYTGDYLSYHQDAVATEAYLGTARQRISVRRHARLVDYRLHEGCNARAWVTVATSADVDLDPAQLFFITRVEGMAFPEGRLLGADDLKQAPLSAYEAFEPLTQAPILSLYAHHNEIPFYTWGDEGCCLPAGSTGATLLDEVTTTSADGVVTTSRALRLRAGDDLLLEEVLGPRTGNPADADPTHRWVVRLTEATQDVDPLYGRMVLNIAWCQADAPPFPLCLSSRLPAPACQPLERVSVARGNVVMVDHGLTLPPEDLGQVPTLEVVQSCACDGAVVDVEEVPGPFAPTLNRSPLTHAQPLAPSACARGLLAQDPHRAVPQVELTGAGLSWLPRQDLLESGADPHVVVEVDDEGIAHLRFGDGELGLRPCAGAAFQARYRLGNGAQGNVGPEAIAFAVLRQGLLDGVELRPRNPLAAQGGLAPEPVAQAKLVAPTAYREELMRAITAADYAALAERIPGLQAADAELAWMGSWYEAQVAVDPLDTEEPRPELLEAIEGGLHPYRRVGHDLEVVSAQYVPLDVELTVCVEPASLRAHVEAELLRVFSDRTLSGGALGFFHPDNLTFGTGVFLSRLVAAAQAVAGVQHVEVTRLERLFQGPNGEIAKGILPMGVGQIPRVDNDPDFPEHGQFHVVMRGGR